MAGINLAPYSVYRFYDGAEVMWLIKFTSQKGNSFSTIDQFETREEAEAERNRLNSKYGLDALGI